VKKGNKEAADSITPTGDLPLAWKISSWPLPKRNVWPGV